MQGDYNGYNYDTFKSTIMKIWKSANISSSDENNMLKIWC